MLNAKHSKWLPTPTTHPTAKQGHNSQTTTESQTRVIPIITRRIDPTTTKEHQNQLTTRKYIQLNKNKSILPPSYKSGIAGANSHRLSQDYHQQVYRAPKQRPSFLKNYEILNQESLAQLLNQNQRLNQNLTLDQRTLLNHNLILDQTHQLNRNQLLRNQKLLLNQLNQTNRRLQTLQTESAIQLPILEDNDQETTSKETTTPIYSIISVPFLARSHPPTFSLSERKLKRAKGLVKTKQALVSDHARENRKIIICKNKQENTLAHLNCIRQVKSSSDNQNYSNPLNTTATVNNLNATTINLNTSTTTTTRTPITTTSSTKMMGIQLPGNEFQDMNGALPIAAVEELMAPVCLDDYFIETNNISDFDANQGTHKLHGFNEMTINQMNVDFANHLQSEEDVQKYDEEQDQQEHQQFMKEVPGEENLYGMLRMPHSEELVSLTQTSLGHETQESKFIFSHYLNDIYSEDSDNSSSYIGISPSSPLPTINDCIATSDLHNPKYMDDKCNSMQNDETSYRIEFSPQQSCEQSPDYHSLSDEEAHTLDLDQILEKLCNPSNPNQQEQQEQQQPTFNLKRNSNHLSNSEMKFVGGKKSKLSIPIVRSSFDIISEDGLATKVPDTPEVCHMIVNWLEDDASLHSFSSSPTWSGTSFAPPDLYQAADAKFENPPSVASSYVGEEPSLYATPSPSGSSNCTLYSTNPNSPAVSVYGNGNSSTRKPRGRPPKQHSDLPDPNVLQKLPESERKRYEDRCRNNEASRQSRQKNKEKQIILMADEEREQLRNNELKKELDALDKTHRKLKKALHRIWAESSQ